MADINLKKNIAVIGCGYWGKNLLRVFNEAGALHTISDNNSETLNKYGRQYPDANRYESYAEVLNTPEIDAVVLATPAETHFTLASEALLANKDVFVEKPLALNVSEGARLVELAKEKRRILMVGHLLHYHPAIIKLKNMVQAGELGRIQYIYSNRLNLGKIRREENILWSFAPHDISIILSLCEELPEEMACHGGNYLHQKIADITMCTMTFPSGIKSHVFVSWLHPVKEQKFVVVGSKQMVVFNDTYIKDKLLIYPHVISWKGPAPLLEKKGAIPVEISTDEPLKMECLHFLDCIKNRTRPLTCGEEGLNVLKVLDAFQDSLEHNGETRRPSTIKSKNQLEYTIHPTAIVEHPCVIGGGTKIWHYSHVMKDCTIGRDCQLGQNVNIASGVVLGDRVKVQNNVSLYTGVICEDDVFLGPSVVLTNVLTPRSHVSRKHAFKSTKICQGATIGANATIVCGNTIGRYAMVGAGAVVTHDVRPHALVYGNPARQHGWACRCGAVLQKEDGHFLGCPECNLRFRLKNDNLLSIEAGD